MPKVSCRDPGSACRGFWATAQAAVQTAAFFAPEWRFLARGAAAGSCAAALEGAIGV